MAEGKTSFVLYADYQELFSHLSDRDAGQLVKHIFKYVNDENPVSKNKNVNLAFATIKMQLKRDLKKWEATRSKRSDAGKLGGIKSGESRRGKANEASASKSKQNEANEAVNANVNVNVININDKKLSDIEAGKTVEFCSITLHRQYTNDRIKKLWDAFLIQNDQEKYLKMNDRVRHFRNWIKTQPYEKEKQQGPEHNPYGHIKTI